MENASHTYRTILGKRLHEIRLEQGLSLRSLGLMSGVDYSHIFDIEHGKANVTIDTLAKLAEALDADIADFFS